VNPLQPPDHWDFAMLTTYRAKVIEVFGFSERQARFLVTVMLHSGVFVERQYCAFAGIVHGQKTTDFLRRLVDAKFAVAVATGPVHRGRLIHVRHKPLYAAIGQVDNRNRKPAVLARLIERVMLLDAVLDDGAFTWLGDGERQAMALRTAAGRSSPAKRVPDTDLRLQAAPDRPLLPRQDADRSAARRGRGGVRVPRHPAVAS
jgi:hypothetical protein